MIPDQKHYQELLALLGSVRDRTITAEQQLRINDLLEQYPDLIQYYVEFTFLNVELHEHRVLSPREYSDLLAEQVHDAAENKVSDLSGVNSYKLEQIRQEAQRQLDAFLKEQEALRRQHLALQRQENTLSLREFFTLAIDRLVGTWAVTVKITGRLALVLLCFAATRYVLNQRVVAVLDEEINARWLRPPEDANLHPGLMELEEGFAKITFKQGTEVIIQAPCTFDLRSKNRMLLEQGMVTAQVPPQAHGFSVKTPQSTVTDFGTEFGLQVKSLRESEVHVFDGRVQCQTLSRKSKPSTTLDITRNKAAVLTASGHLGLQSLDSRPNLFLRKMPDQNDLFAIPNKRLDLTDIVGGGSGFGTGKRLTCINPATGEVYPRYRYEKRLRGADYALVPALPMVDGVFVPLGPGGFTSISSSGYHYEFPPTQGGSWFVEVAHAGVANLDDRNPVPLTLGEKIFGQGNHPALLMHANVGITFDLDAIRESLNGTQIRSFTSYCGVSNRPTETMDPVTDFYVLVDGQLKFNREISMRTLQIPRVQIRLRADHRFLTLVCLAGEANNGDWSFFGEPALELEPSIE